MALDKKMVAATVGVGVAGVGLLTVPLLASGDGGATPASPSPSNVAPTFTSFPTETSTPTPTATATPTETASTPTETPTEEPATPTVVLNEAIAAYEKKVNAAGGVKETLFYGDGRSVTAQYQTSGATKAVYTGEDIAQSVTTPDEVTYVQLSGNELESMKTVRKKAGKPNATWTTVSDKWMPTLVSPTLTRVYLPDSINSLRPGLTIRSVVNQKKQQIVSARLNGAKITNKAVRDAYSISKKSTSIRVEFWVDKNGVLSRVVVNGKGDPSQTVVDVFAPTTIAAPSDADVITGTDLVTAVKQLS